MVGLCTGESNSILKTLDSVAILQKEAGGRVQPKAVMFASAILTVPVPRFMVSLSFLDETGMASTEVSSIVTYGKSSIHESLTTSPSPSRQVTI